MSNKHASFDLIREKQELDAFLSAITAIVKTSPDEVENEKIALSTEPAPAELDIALVIERAAIEPESEAIDALAGEDHSPAADDVLPQTSYEHMERGLQQKDPASVMSDQAMPAEVVTEKKQAPVLEDTRGQNGTPWLPEEREKAHTAVDRLEMEGRQEDHSYEAGRLEESRDRVDDQEEGSGQERTKAEYIDVISKGYEETAISTPAVIPEADRTVIIKPVALPSAEPEIEKTVPLPVEEIKKSAAKKTPKTKGKEALWVSSWVRAAAIFVVFIAVAIQGYLWMNPEAGQQAIQLLSSNIPFVEKFFAVEKSQQQIISGQIKFINVKQRYVNNVLLGNVRVIEGTAVNHANYPVTKIRVLGKLYDAKNAVLAARSSYCGNVLSDDKLGSLSEEEIRAALSIPQGSDLSNNKILPQGKIAFMIVFTREPVSVLKATVMPVSLEKAI